MGYRTIEISCPSEIHVKNGQLQVIQEEGTVQIPVEDISQVFCIGADIRLSTMALSKLAQAKVGVITLDNKYLPTAIVLPYEGHTRQSKIMHAQVRYKESLKIELWRQIVYRKIANQARNLSILGIEDAEQIVTYAQDLTNDNAESKEALAAKAYFELFHPGLNRRTDDPINSRLNYGYAIVRSAIIRALVVTGFHPALGIHHNNQLNTYNLADDLIEPYRPMVDMVAYYNMGSNVLLTKGERYKIAHVLHNACMIDGYKTSVLNSVEVMCESLKRCYLEENTLLLKLPTILPIEEMEPISE